MQVPVKVIIDTDTKAFDIKIGTPPASGLVKKEAGIDKVFVKTVGMIWNGVGIQLNY